ncbi:1937_t:CDS:10 [Acaulospora morrowiae]|uniref:1937_t:CDS:1 n=1 Tax=Acaulospora morrowiae TaxID=94023 RepID=A0A9N8W4R0_9GLOM|nr:1937_t:CDS:10 [Acaulospora morrowiae]
MILEEKIKQRRVKVYQLSRESEWIDKGTGFCTCLCNETKDDAYIVVHSEEDSTSVLLRSQILKDQEYQKQQDTLVVWTEPTGMDLALSFQEAEGCTEICDFISEIKNHMNLENSEDISSSPFDSEIQNMTIKLPEPTLANLQDIELMIKNASRSLIEREKLASFITQDYISKLFPLFSTCEDLEDRNDLHRLCSIMKGIIMLQDSEIYEFILRDDVIMQVVGMLEYDPEFPNYKANHRQYLSDNSKFKEIVKIKDKAIEAKIHETFRLQYLKDVVFARVFDDPTILSSLIFFNHVDICKHISQDDEFLAELFNILNEEGEDSKRKRDVVMFVQQLCSIAKNIHFHNRKDLYKSLAKHGLFQIFEYSLVDEDPSVRTTGGEILAFLLDTDASIIRSYIVKQVDEGKKTLVEILIERFIQDEDLGVKAQYAEAFRLLLDMNAGLSEIGFMVPPESLSLIPKQDEDIGKFLDVFYDELIPKLVKPIFDLPELEKDDDILDLSPDKAALCYHICELLSFIIRQHTFRSKYFVISTNVTMKMCSLLKTRETYVKLAALRCFRACIGMKEEFYNRHLVRNNHLEPIIHLLVGTNGKNNLLNSACLELFEFIRKENIKPLVNSIMEKYGDQLIKIDYVDTFRQLQLRYEQNKEVLVKPDKSPGESSQSQNNTQQMGHEGWSSGVIDEDEEAYFNTSDDEDNGVSVETSKTDTTSVEEETKDGLKSESDSSGESKEADSAKASNAGKVGLVDYPDEDYDNEDVKKDTTEPMALDKSKASSSPPSSPRPTKTHQASASESSLPSNGTSTRKAGLKILRSSQTLRPKLKKARME